MRVAGTALLGLMCLAPPVLAGPHCRVPLGEWQPREALQAKLEQQGWMVVSIRVDDGCYKVRATNQRGESLERKFDPRTLNQIRRPAEHDDDD